MNELIIQLDSLTSNIIIGILTGILTTALLYLISKMFADWLIPWYRNIKYIGIDVSGVWETKQEFDNSKEYSLLNLRQEADKLYGLWTISITQNGSDQNEIKTFKVNGSIEDRFALLISKNTDRRQIGIGTMLIEAIGNGFELKGCETWYSVDNKAIKSDTILFKRKK
ncbi:MAG: hypothetical protein GQ540_04995 [Lutibacter sp.]|uniref:hypothetical protein n=1 Tax=Lutibacter sp. TaxID=1925666 RepID=UPI0019F5913D|nr:hypothetical protein [Lutibacter sp.]NOR27868.1 hypothetical protein [Lutibacter sp.]